jgi:hypothetical protein
MQTNSSDTGKPNKTWEAFTGWVVNYLATVLSFGGGLLATLQDLAGERDPTLVTYLFAWTVKSNLSLAATSLLVLGFFGEVFKFNEIRTLKKLNLDLKESNSVLERSRIENEKLSSAYKAQISFHLFEFSKLLSLGFSERVSIYRHKKLDGKEIFFLLGRYSLNEENNKVGRTKYPVDQGCLGEILKHGEFARSFPDPDKKESLYLAAHAEYGILEETVNNFTMKPQTYVGYLISTETHISQKAIILFESTKALQERKNKKLDREKLKKAISGTEGQSLLNFLSGMSVFEPNPEITTEKGL